ncbi:hypothetical protein DICPUDRAFT_41389 [Dictyostelium purpureum]|uniref:Gamma-butyrobetaine hydroxylase-like N-terminal domain-containing protein n=1 Tax=Dictyostelium purpureum TaxID=5786 RepID=F1A002_DICPU|nr:uncharacterized protein DICPUDRAFT_41389 [Dictyostelium purpureum]EGC30467.1 hypothetical protein DICPUDRAFT_41389 [Dictyostelium purpureum]|eukprot:XP_003292996.1 hypothetical protein DICPUDRAFT_41389 [Dictyostelium purpureum]
MIKNCLTVYNSSSFKNINNINNKYIIASLSLNKSSCYNTINNYFFINNNNYKRYFSSSEKYNVHPTEIKLTEKGKRLDIKFDDNNQTNYSFSSEFLRIETPSVEKGKSIVSGKRNVKISKIERVGNYAIRLVYDDLHETGIYSWEYLFQLGKSKYTRMKKYLKDLKVYNRSRDPPQTTQTKQQIIEKILKDTKEKEKKENVTKK